MKNKVFNKAISNKIKTNYKFFYKLFKYKNNSKNLNLKVKILNIKKTKLFI